MNNAFGKMAHRLVQKLVDAHYDSLDIALLECEDIMSSKVSEVINAIESIIKESNESQEAIKRIQVYLEQLREGEE